MDREEEAEGVTHRNPGGNWVAFSETHHVVYRQNDEVLIEQLAFPLALCFIWLHPAKDKDHNHLLGKG